MICQHRHDEDCMFCVACQDDASSICREDLDENDLCPQHSLTMQIDQFFEELGNYKEIIRIVNSIYWDDVIETWERAHGKDTGGGSMMKKLRNAIDELKGRKK